MNRETLKDMALAAAIGVIMALALLHWWSS